MSVERFIWRDLCQVGSGSDIQRVKRRAVWSLIFMEPGTHPCISPGTSCVSTRENSAWFQKGKSDCSPSNNWKRFGWCSLKTRVLVPNYLSLSTVINFEFEHTAPFYFFPYRSDSSNKEITWAFFGWLESHNNSHKHLCYFQILTFWWCIRPVILT